jgi:hypothetical protein
MQGLDKFREYMSGFRSHYVVIGGVATVLTLEDRGLPARATKDVDMIIICQPESKFYMKRFWEFVKAGGYKLWKPDDKEDFSSANCLDINRFRKRFKIRNMFTFVKMLIPAC